jgi:hypothetical protein
MAKNCQYRQIPGDFCRKKWLDMQGGVHSDLAQRCYTQSNVTWGGEWQ